MKKFIIILFLLAIWQLTYSIFQLNFSYIPSPIDIFQAFLSGLSSGELLIHVLASLQRVLIGYLIATIVGITLALVLAYYRTLGNNLRIIIELLRPVPPIAWIPIAIIIFGLGNTSAYFIVFLGAFFPIFTSTYVAAISLPRVYRDVVSSFELSKYIYVSKILFPFCLPGIFTGLKVGMGTAWMSVIAAELVSGQSGLGYFIQINRLLLRADNVLVGMVLIGLIGYLLNGIISFIERKVVIWRR